MSTKKILKNITTDETLNILGVDVDPLTQLEIQKNKWFELADSEEIHNWIDDEKIVVNNGIEDLPKDIGKAHVTDGVIKVHRDVHIKSGVGIKAPEMVELDHAVVGYNVDMGDKGYFDTRTDNILGNTIDIDFHYCIDNADKDRYVKFKVHIVSSCGDQDILLNQSTYTLDFGPFEVSTIPFQIKKRTVTLPIDIVKSDTPYLFVSIERIEPGEGYTSPDKNPVVVRICKEYWKKVIT